MPIRKTSIHSQYAGAQFDNKLRNTTILYKLQELVQAILRMSRSKSGALACLKILHLRWRCRSNLCLSAKSTASPQKYVRSREPNTATPHGHTRSLP